MMRAERLENVKKEIRSVIITYPSGVTLDIFLKAYRQLVGVRLPTREFGFISDLDFLHSLTDIVRVQTDQNGEYHLKCVVDENIEHISKLVSKQRVTKSKSKSSSNGNINEKTVNVCRTKPFVSAALRKNLFEVLNNFPEGLSYFPLLAAYQKRFKRPLNLDFLTESNHEKFDKLALAVPELKVVTADDTKKLLYCPFVRNKKQNIQENKFPLEKPVENLSANGEAHQNSDTKSVTNSSEVFVIPKVVLEDFEKVLKLYPDGVLGRHFPFLYERVSGDNFNLADLGYHDFMELADALPEIFICVQRYDKPHDFMLFHPSFSENAETFKDKNKTLEIASKKSEEILKIEKKEIPSDVVSISVPYSQPQFPSDANLSVYIPIFISAIISPSCFWFKLQFEDVICRFRELEEEMQCFYHSCLADSYKMLEKDITIGATCTALHEDHWYRATVTSSPTAELIMVYFVDYGSWEKVHCSKLCYLKTSFIHLPSQAFKAKLALVKPAKGAKTWSLRAESRFLNLCNKSYIMAQIHLEFDDMVSVFLCDTSGDEDIHINDILADEGLAESYSEEDFSFDILPQNNQIPEINNYTNGERNLISTCCSNEHTPLQSSVSEPSHQKVLKKVSPLVTRFPFGDEYVLHSIFVFNKIYVSAGELCRLFWSDKSPEVLKARLQQKNVEISTVNISKREHRELFQQCERISVNGFQDSSSDYSVTLYALTDVMKILNCLGHPSIDVRDAIIRHLKNSDQTTNDTYKELKSLSIENGSSETPINSNDDFNKYCLYDLKLLYEMMKLKRMKLQKSISSSHSNCALNELMKVKNLIDEIEKRIEHIKLICSSYTNYE